MESQPWMVCIVALIAVPIININIIGWTRISAFHFAEELSLRVNCRVIFGDNLGKFEPPNFYWLEF